MDLLIWVWVWGTVLMGVYFYRSCPKNLPALGWVLHVIVGIIVALGWPLVFLGIALGCFYVEVFDSDLTNSTTKGDNSHHE